MKSTQLPKILTSVLDAIFGAPTQASIELPKQTVLLQTVLLNEWDFGSMQAKVKIANGSLSWKLFGNGGSTYPLASINGVQYENGGPLSWVGDFVVLGAGGNNKRVQVPKTEKSAAFIQEINACIDAFKQAHMRSPLAPSTFSLADELAKLAGLRQQGFLTEAEFEQQKQRLLAER